MPTEISLQTLLESGAHFGHQSRRWNPKMQPFLFGIEKGVHVFDLTITKKYLEEALGFIESSAKEGKTILFVGTKKQVKVKIKQVAEETGCFYVNERWLGGILTNFEQIQKSLKKMNEMKEDRKAGKFSKYTKKERILLDREIVRLERFLSGLVGMTSQPNVMVVVDIKKESGAVIEAGRMGVVTIGIVDSNSDPEKVDYPIPMNDDATNALNYVLDLMKQAILLGKHGTSKTKKGRSQKNKSIKTE